MDSTDCYDYYGVRTENWVTEPAREIYMLRKGGKWTVKGRSLGNGTLFHFKELIRVIWPEVVQHRWFNTFVENWLLHKFIAVLGPRNSGKSLNACVCHLADYYCWPECTTTLVCSTTKERLEDRIWGEIKKFHRAARSRFPGVLPGHLIEGRQRIVTDDRDEATEGRDFRNGLTGCAAKRGDKYVGLCFAPGTFVDTPSGSTTIENIKPGDLVLSALGPSTVIATSERLSQELLTVHLTNGKTIRCTPNHPFLTTLGWVNAVDLTPEHQLVSTNEAMCSMSDVLSRQDRKESVLQSEMPSTVLDAHLSPMSQDICEERSSLNFLQQVLFSEVEHVEPGDDQENPGEPGQRGDGQKGERDDHGESGRAYASVTSQKVSSGRSRSCTHGKELEDSPRTRPKSVWQSRKWNAAVSGREGFVSPFPRGHVRASDSFRLRLNVSPEQNRIPALLSSRSRLAGFETLSRSGRRKSPAAETEGTRSKKATGSEIPRVDFIEIHQRSGSKPNKRGQNYYRVHNLHVAGHPSYSVEGLLVHNSEFQGIKNKRVRLCADELSSLPRSFIDAIATLDVQGDQKVTGMGNPAQTTDALGLLAEPHTELGGWEGGIDQSPKTKTWKTRFDDGICIQFPGSDSPNLDETEAEIIARGGPKYPFLISREQMEKDMATWGKDDWHYTMFDEGRMPRGQGSHRVITRQLCLKHHAMEEPVWLNTNLQYVTALDAAYRAVGGDRCVFMRLAYGLEAKPLNATEMVETLVNQTPDSTRYRTIIALLDTFIIPIQDGNYYTCEDQIVMFCKQKHDMWHLPPDVLYFDAGMRTSLVTAFARLWSPKVNSIDFGGKPPLGRVSADIDVECRDYYDRFVTYLWWSSRLAIESEQLRGLSEDIVLEGCTREWKQAGSNKISVETKTEMKVKAGRSPDLYDCLVTGLEGARQKGFVISRLGDPNREPGDNRWKRELMRKAREFQEAHQLIYTT